MHISRVKIKNFKCFKDTFSLELNNGLNIIVGNNEAGKSTILEAIHLALTGLSNGKYVVLLRRNNPSFCIHTFVKINNSILIIFVKTSQP